MKVQESQGFTEDERGVQEYWVVKYRVSKIENCMRMDISKPGKNYRFVLEPLGDSHFQGIDDVDGNKLVGLFVKDKFKATWGRWKFWFQVHDEEKELETALGHAQLKEEPPVNIEDLEARIIQLEEENETLKKQVQLDDADIHDFFMALQKKIFANGLEKGWWKKPGSFPEGTGVKPLEVHALVHCEIAEASEEVRKGSQPIHKDPMGKYQGEAIELADAVMIIMSYFESKGWNLGDAIHLKHEHNKTRPFRDGYKKY